METRWLIIAQKDDLENIVDGCRANNVDFWVAEYKAQFTLDIPEKVAKYPNTFVYAPVYGVNVLCSHFGWKSYMPLDTLRCSKYYPFFPVSQKNPVFLPAKLVLDQWDLHAVDDLLFVRPDTNDKRFNGEVFSKNEFRSLLCGLEPDVLCVVSPPRIFKEEYRILMIDGEPITASKYKPPAASGIPNSSELRDWWIKARGAGYQLPDMVHFDVAIEYEYKMSLMELSSVNAAGLYQQDPIRFVEEISRKCQKDFVLDE